MDLTKIKTERFSFLDKLYQEACGSENAAFSMYELGSEIGFDHDRTVNVVNYLMKEGLIEAYGLGGTIKISHYGIKEIEDAHARPEKATAHFAPINHIHINSTGDGNIINTGDGNTFKVNNNFKKDEVKQKVNEIIKSLENDLSLAKSEKDAAITVFSQLVEEYEAEKPLGSLVDKVLTMGANISSIGSLAISLFQLLTTKN